ncbi:MAG: hypothetical protein K8T90_11685 [Planctomycetes bacterium]|nr:hypothetical protein [Planctomycetota bacterium]
MPGHRRTTFLLVATILASTFLVSCPADADEPAKGPGAPPATPPAPAAENVTDVVAKVALDRLARDIADPSPKVRVEAVTRAAIVIHPTVANALLDIGTKHDEARIRVIALQGVARQTPSAKEIGPKLSKYLGAAAEEGRKKRARGDYGIRIDPKTGKTDTESDEGKAALLAKRERGQTLAEAVRALDALGHRDRDTVEVLLDFLSDGNDDLVAHIMTMFGKWKEWSVLPEFVDLYEMYPAEDKVNMGSTSVDTGAAGSADAQSAKRAWASKYGDPDRRRARPKVVRAMRQAVFDITGEKIEDVQTYRDFLRKPEVKRKVK